MCRGKKSLALTRATSEVSACNYLVLSLQKTMLMPRAALALAISSLRPLVCLGLSAPVISSTQTCAALTAHHQQAPHVSLAYSRIYNILDLIEMNFAQHQRLAHDECTLSPIRRDLLLLSSLLRE